MDDRECKKKEIKINKVKSNIGILFLLLTQQMIRLRF